MELQKPIVISFVLLFDVDFITEIFSLPSFVMRDRLLIPGAKLCQNTGLAV